MASLNRYVDDKHGRYTKVPPSALQAGLKTQHVKIGHINVSKALNMNAGPHRAAAISTASTSLAPYTTFGTDLSANGKQYAVLGGRQNDLYFSFVRGRRAATQAHVLAEQPNIVFTCFTGIKFKNGITQDEFEEQFLFSGVGTRDYEYGEPGSTIGVSLTGLNTVWLAGTDVYAGDRIRWRLPSIDPDVRAREIQSESVLRQDARPKNQLVAMLERAEPTDVAMAPKTWLHRWYNEASKLGTRDHKLMLNPYDALGTVGKTKQTWSSKEIFVAGQLAFAQWVAMSTIAWLHQRGGTLPTNTQAMDLLGITGNGQADNLHVLYGMAFGGMLPSGGVKIETNLSDGRKALLAAAQREAAISQFSSLTIAHNAERNHVIFTAVESAPGWGKCDVYN